MTDVQTLLSQPVIIVGAPRSGTTVLGQWLEPHPAVFSANEPRLIWRWGNDRKSDALRPQDARPEVIRHIRQAFANQMTEAGASLLVEKTPSNALRLPFVQRVFPDARFINIMRHGGDSALSIRTFWDSAGQGLSTVRKGALSQRLREAGLRRLPYYGVEAARRFAPSPISRMIGRNIWGPRLPGIRGMVSELDLLEVCCLQWRMCTESACFYGRQLPADRYMEVKLEEMDTERFRELLAFTGLDDEPALIEKFEASHQTQQAGSRMASASEEDLETIRRCLGPTLAWLGYDLPNAK